MRTRSKFWFSLTTLLMMLVAPVISKAQTASATKTALAASGKKSTKAAPASPVDLNSATQADLQSVPGIGAATAKKIIASRPYSSVSDLSKAGISSKQIQSFSSMVKVGSAPAGAAPSGQMASTPAAPPPSTSSKRSSSPASASNGPAASAPLAPGGGAGMVWVNPETKVFHRQGDKWYGKTKKGKYMSEGEAVKAGYRASKEG